MKKKIGAKITRFPSWDMTFGSSLHSCVKHIFLHSLLLLPVQEIFSRKNHKRISIESFQWVEHLIDSKQYKNKKENKRILFRCYRTRKYALSTFLIDIMCCWIFTMNASLNGYQYRFNVTNFGRSFDSKAWETFIHQVLHCCFRYNWMAPHHLSDNLQTCWASTSITEKKSLKSFLPLWIINWAE